MKPYATIPLCEEDQRTFKIAADAANAAMANLNRLMYLTAKTAVPEFKESDYMQLSEDGTQIQLLTADADGVKTL